MYILAMAVTPTVVLHQVNMQSASHFTSHCVKASEHPDFPMVEKKKLRGFVKSVEEILKHFLIIHLSKEMTGPWEIWEMFMTLQTKSFASTAVGG